MSTTTIKSADKIKLLDQMLEDIAGDEYEEFDVSEASITNRAKHYDYVEEIDINDKMH